MDIYIYMCMYVYVLSVPYCDRLLGCFFDVFLTFPLFLSDGYNSTSSAS